MFQNNWFLSGHLYVYEFARSFVYTMYELKVIDILS